ncbi:hypothetical protein JS278_02887 [Acidipropionibacterium virtanenii]|uniref:Cytoplasmic protein n=2 Tax=Acidipropionibacterium virtanenii TaxID=2057246 RepID=A0A344UXM3_9ACTN|nr:hypothetical protein JS278_02887 [Acidipropionibacterium virtanenii]
MSGYPFTPHLAVYKVAGHVFLIVTEDPDEQIITIKVEPAHAIALIREHASIEAGRYLDKRHWMSVGPGAGIAASLIDDLVRGSYELVVEQMNRSDLDRIHRKLDEE